MKSQFLGILLICLLTLPVSSTYVYLKIYKNQIKKEIKHKIINEIDKKELVLLKFSHSEAKTKLKWEHSKEFEYNQEMYDVVEKEITKDSVFYWCWWDFEETKLNRKLMALVKNHLGKSEQKQEKESTLFHFLEKLFFEEMATFLKFSTSNKAYSLGYLNNYQSLHQDVFLPPPELV